MTTIHAGAAQGPGRLNLRDLAPDWDPYHAALGGTAAAFAARNYLLDNRPDATRVGICQYRKFVSTRRISGVRDPKYKVMDDVPKAMLEGEAYARALDPGEADFLVSCARRFTRLPWYRRGYLKEYARDHHVEDFLLFTAHAVEQGALDASEVLAFCREDVLVPGGVELGVYPAAFWLDAIGRIERVVRECVTRHPRRREGYQARMWSFCAERLGSWLLLKHLRSEVATGPLSRHWEWLNRRRWSGRFAGQLNLIVEEDHAGYRGGH
ncbi:MAG TPA: hypothetical protein VLU41_03010 [Ideonella sp.]|nr:hypothetical protein [Ideonella sp.]